MEVLFLGTGAADRMNVAQDNDFENKDHRRCSCALLDGKIMLDCGPHALSSLEIANIDISEITDIFITHLHADHFNLDSINYIAKHVNNLKVWVRSDAAISGRCDIEICRMEPYKTYKIGDYCITGLCSNHEAFAQHLSIEKDTDKLFYGLDGAWLLNETVTFMKNKNYNTIILDATVGDYAGDYRIGEHNSIPMIRLMTESMKTLNIINDDTKVVLSHIACCLHKSYSETCDIVKPDGYIVAYDGLKIMV